MRLSRLGIAFLLAALLHLGLSFLPINNQPTELQVSQDQPISITISKPTVKQNEVTEPAPDISEPPPSPPPDKPREPEPEPLKIPEPEPIAEPEEVAKAPQKISPQARKVKVPQKEKRVQQVVKQSQEVKPRPQPQVSPTPPPAPAGKSQEPRLPPVLAKPRYQDNPKPVYPPLAKRKRWQGTVMLQVVVEPDGTASSCKLEKSSGYDILDKSALRAVKKWRFIPEKEAGIGRRSTILVPVQFVLHAN